MVKIRYADNKIKKSFERLKEKDEYLYRHIKNAIENIKDDPSCCIKIPKKLFPKDWCKEYKIDNLFKYNLPNGWRLFYSLKGLNIEVVAILLGFMNHKNYERKFNY